MQQPDLYDPARRLEDAWTFLLSSRQGRVVLRDLLEITNFGTSAWAGNGEATLVASGKQLVGEHIMGMLTTCYPEAYALMIKESKEDRDYDDARNRASSERDDSRND